MSTPSVLVVCLGNICRSPMGEAVLKRVAADRGVDIIVDSAGTAGYHVGGEPDERTLRTCHKHNVPIDHRARQVSPEDFRRYNYILAADESNLRSLQRIKPSNSTAEVRLWGSYLDNKSIPDPYYGGDESFEQCYEQCQRLSNTFLDQIIGETMS